MSTNETNSAPTNGEFEDQIRGALGDLRVDRAAFADGVNSRIGKGGNGQQDGDFTGGLDLGDAPVQGDNFMSRAAAILPPLLLPKGLAKAGIGTGGGVVSTAGLKFLPGLAAMPIVVVMMLAMTLIFGLRSLVATSAGGRQMGDQKEAALEVKEWWKRNFRAAFLVGVFLVYAVFRMPADAAAFVLLASTLALIGIVGKLSSSGLATRAEIATQALGMTCTLSGIMMSLTGMSGVRIGPVSTGYALPILIVGGLLLWTVRLVENGRRLKIAVPLVLAIGAFFAALLVGLVQLTGKWQVESTDVVEWIEDGTEFEVSRPSQWKEVASSMRHLVGAGEVYPEMENLTQTAWESIDEQRAEGTFNRLYGHPVLEWGIAREEDCKAWLSDYDERQIRELRLRTMNFPSAAVKVLAYQGLFGLTDAEKDQILSATLASLPDVDAYGAIGDYLTARRLMKSIGRALPEGSLEERIEKLLLATWTPSNDGMQAAFPGSPDLQSRDANGNLDVDLLTFVWMNSTADSLEAMSLFGIPEGIDLRLLERYLVHQSMEFKHSGVDPYHAIAATSLAHLRAMPEFQEFLVTQSPPGPMETLSKYRLPLAALLLMAFAIAATLRAPSQR